uniref:Uncharacterized protein n=1 Tax=Ditylenchus dipsaci TaxID=166011 RepID=A0A915ED39_9BILA
MSGCGSHLSQRHKRKGGGAPPTAGLAIKGAVQRWLRLLLECSCGGTAKGGLLLDGNVPSSWGEGELVTGVGVRELTINLFNGTPAIGELKWKRLVRGMPDGWVFRPV